MVELYATKSESKQAENITRMLQTELAGNLKNQLYSVEQNVKRTVREFPSGESEEIKKNASTYLDILSNQKRHAMT